MREICKSGSEEGLTGVIQSVYSNNALGIYGASTLIFQLSYYRHPRQVARYIPVVIEDANFLSSSKGGL